MIDRLWPLDVLTVSETGLLCLSLLIGWLIARAVQNQLENKAWLSAPLGGIRSESLTLAAASLVSAALSAALLSPVFAWVGFLLAAVLLASAYYDLKTFILPDLLTLCVLVLGVVVTAIFFPSRWLDALIGAGLGFGLMYAIEVYYRRLRGRSGLGRGDAKLMGALGVWTGATGLPFALLIGSGAALISLVAVSIVRRKAISGQMQIAFGPWLALGGWLVWMVSAAWLV